jgi:hypothetical protein
MPQSPGCLATPRWLVMGGSVSLHCQTSHPRFRLSDVATTPCVYGLLGSMLWSRPSTKEGKVAGKSLPSLSDRLASVAALLASHGVESGFLRLPEHAFDNDASALENWPTDSLRRQSALVAPERSFRQTRPTGLRAKAHLGAVHLVQSVAHFVHRRAPRRICSDGRSDSCTTQFLGEL